MTKELLLGDNPFFGVDNLSQERARKRMQSLDGLEKIADIMDYVSKFGVKGFVVSTHPQLRELLEYLEKNTSLLKKFEFYPILPYAQGYVTLATEKGVVKAANDLLAAGKMQDKVKILLKGSIGYLKKDVGKLIETLIDVELLPFKNARKKTVFLHDGVTDLVFGLGMKQIVETFFHHIEDNYGTSVGLVTKNLPTIMQKLDSWNMKIPTIMASFNPLGYLMNPSREAYEDSLGKSDVIAMNVLAAGYLKPEESFEYIFKHPIQSVVVGMSTKEHAEETINSFKKFNEI